MSAVPLSTETAENALSLLAPFQVDVLNSGAVMAYLNEHDGLAELLPDICGEARREFGQAELSLALYRDPEIADEYLTLYVRQSTYQADILARIDRLSQSFADPLERAAGYFLVTTDFRPPRGKHAI